MVERWWGTSRFVWIAACVMVLVGGLATVAMVSSGAERGDPSTDDTSTATPGSDDETVLETGQVEGRVTGTDGQPLAGVEVVVRTAPFSSWTSGPGKPPMPPGPTWKGTTDEDGRYRINGVTVGPHRVGFSRPGHAEAFNGAAVRVDDASDVQVEGDTAAEVDVTMARAGRIRGRVLRAAGGAVPPDVRVEAVLTGPEDGAVVSTASTRSRGRYVLDGLAPGRYVVRVTDPSSGIVHHPAAVRVKSATVLRIKEGQRTSGVDVNVPKPAVITGRVLSQDGRPMTGVRVRAHQGIQDMGRYGMSTIGLEEVLTDRAGRYRLEKPTSTLSLWAGEGAAPSACEGVLDGVKGWSVEAGREYVRDLREPRPAAISGTVTDTAGKALRNIPVAVERIDSSCSEQTRTDRNGRYQLDGLKPGKYRALFAQSLPKRSIYLPIHYGGNANPDSARVLRMKPGSSRTGVDVELQKGGQITGDVALPDGVRLDDLTVWAIQIETEEGASVAERMGRVGENGRFSLVGLRSGRYRLSFTPTFTGSMVGRDVVPTLFHTAQGSTTDPDEATAIDVTVGESTRGVEVKLDLGASISGRVVDGDGKPRDIAVVAHRRGASTDGAGDDEWVTAASSWTDSEGRYSLRGLGAGTYRINFGGTEGEYFPDVKKIDDARDLELDSDEAMTGIDAEVVFDWD